MAHARASRHMRILGVVVTLGLSIGVLAGVAGSLTPPEGVVDQVTICHRTNSNSNPYVQNTPDVSGVLNGHADQHTGPVWDPTLKAQHIKWGDVIPPFDYTQGPGVLHFDGLNWTTEGQALYKNDCQPLEPPPEQQYGSITVTKVVSGLPLVGNPVGGTVPDGFTVHVSCDDGTEQDVTFPVSGGAGTPATIDGIEAGSSCTVIEQNTGTFPTGTAVTYDPANAPTGFFVDAEQEVAVQVTNDFVDVLVEAEEVTAAPPVPAQPVTIAPAFTG